MNYNLYLVGGFVRDNLLGIKSKDIDYSVVVEESMMDKPPLEVFDKFHQQLLDEGYEIFLLTPECFTIRAMFPKGHEHSGVADFVLARKELEYIPNTRTPKVELGTLKDDLERRDFTVNALAKDLDGNIVDYFDGQKDLLDGILRTPTDTGVSFNDDPLRIIRGLRFMVTKGFMLSDNIIETIQLFDTKRLAVVSDERMMGELNKMYEFDTLRANDIFYWLKQINPSLYDNIFGRDYHLVVSNKKVKTNKKK